MKKLGLCLAVIGCLGLTACGSDDSINGSTNSGIRVSSSVTGSSRDCNMDYDGKYSANKNAEQYNTSASTDYYADVLSGSYDETSDADHYTIEIDPTSEIKTYTNVANPTPVNNIVCLPLAPNPQVYETYEEVYVQHEATYGDNAVITPYEPESQY